jgi:uncharacterized phage-associated protein
MTYDVRSVANFILDVADAERREVSNLHINKIVYFLHADFLVAFSRPLVSAKIEAWTHGPVFREIYREFKTFGSGAITGRAQYLDPVSGNKLTAKYSFNQEETRFIAEQAKRYIRMSASALVSQSHIEGGPWDKTWNHDGNTNASMRISDELIKDWYGKAVKH